MVDWVDYAAGIDAVDSDTLAQAALDRAGTGDIWLVSSNEYRQVEGRCEEVADALDAPTSRTVVREGNQFEKGSSTSTPHPDLRPHLLLHPARATEAGRLRVVGVIGLHLLTVNGLYATNLGRRGRMLVTA